MRFNNIFSQTQVGFITEIVEPVHVKFNLDYVKTEFEKDPELSAIPVETESGISGFIEREQIMRDQGVIDTLLHGNIKSFLKKPTVTLNARENIEKALRSIYLSNGHQVDNCMVYQHGSFYGMVNSRKLINHILKLRTNEMIKASEIQNCILGSKLMETPVFRAEVMIQMAHEVGGDFFLINKFGKEKYMVACMDVSGKDISASLITGLVGGYFSSLSYLENADTITGSRIITQLHTIFRERTPDGYFIAGLIVFIDTSSNSIEIFNMGYSPLCIIKTEGSEKQIKIKNPSLPPIGLPSFEITEETILKFPISKDLAFFAFSDGLTDAQNMHGQSFGEQKVYETLKTALKTDRKRTLETMEKEIAAFIGATPQVDDITAMMIDFS